MNTPTAEVTSEKTVMDEFMRLDRIIRDCEESIAISERRKSAGRWQAKWDAELAATHEKLATAKRERDWLDGAVARYAVSR